MRESISTVVLDLDDTLIATARARKRAYRALRDHGIDPREAESVQRRWWQAYYRGECSMADLRQGRWIDLGLPPAKVQEIDEMYRRHHEEIRPRHGARVLLQALRSAGVQTVLLSNAGIDYVQERVRTMGLEHLLDGVVDLQGAPFKPHPEAFQAALDLAGGTPERAAMVGDNLEVDVEGALDFGFRLVIWLTRRKPHPDSRVLTVPSLRLATEVLMSRLQTADTTEP
jgi:putative hydrolase of the HAD superfamily